MQQPHFHQYPYRYIILALFSLGTFVNGMAWVVASGISVPIAKAYDQPQQVVDFVSMIYQIMYVFGNIASNWVVREYGLRWNFVLASGLTAFGCAIRCMVNYNFHTIIIGQIFCALAQPCYLSTPAAVAVRWFLTRDRAVAISILFAFNITGMSFGVFFPSLFVSQNETPTAIRSQFFIVNLIETAMAVLPAVLIVLFFREHPQTPAGIQKPHEQITYFEQVKVLLCDKRMVLMIVVEMILSTVMIFYTSLVDSIFSPYGYSSSEASLMGSITLAIGTVSTITISYCVQKSRKYQLALKALAIFGILCHIFFLIFILIIGHSLPLALLIMACFGLYLLSSQTLMFDYSCDVMFPRSEVVVNGLMMTAGQIMPMLMVFFVQEVFRFGDDAKSLTERKESSLKSVVLFSAVALVGLVCMYRCDFELTRSKAEMEIERGNRVQPDGQ